MIQILNVDRGEKVKELNILGNLLSPFNGIAIMGIVAIWATTKFDQGPFKFWLLGFAGFCVISAAIGDILHHKFRNRYEQEKEIAIKKSNQK